MSEIVFLQMWVPLTQEHRLRYVKLRFMNVCSKRILAWESISYPYKSWGGIVWKVKAIRIPVAAGGAEGILHSRPLINEPSCHGHTAPCYQEVTSVGHIIGNVWDFLSHPQRNVVENKILPCSQDQERTHFFWVTLSKGDGRSPERSLDSPGCWNSRTNCNSQKQKNELPQLKGSRKSKLRDTEGPIIPHQEDIRSNPVSS